MTSKKTEGIPSAAGPGGNAVGARRPRRWVQAILVCGLVAPWLVVGLLLLQLRPANEITKALPSSREQVVEGKPGPWGSLEYAPLRIDLPDEYIQLPSSDTPPIRWFFKGHSKERALEFLHGAGLDASQLEVLRQANWKVQAEGAAVEPGDDLILGLAPAVRAKIYLRLVEFPENAAQIDPIWFHAGQVDERLKDSGLSSSSVALLKSLLYPQGSSLLLLADIEPAARHLTDPQEQHEFLKAVSRKKSLLARLKIDAQSDIEKLVDYWGAGGRKKDLAPLLGALRHEGRCKLNVIFLLPQFLRDHLYNHPFLSEGPNRAKQDSFWSAMNTFNEPPDDRFSDMPYVHQVLDRDYYKIQEPSRLGDLVFLATADQVALHAAVFIADDVVFTKNGDSYAQPWILMRLADMIDTHAARHPSQVPLNVLYFRKKEL